jgi:DNA ligase-1
MSLAAGESTTVQGSGKNPYVVKNHDDRIWSCDCPAWRNSGGKVDLKTCKHTKKVHGEANEAARLARNMGGVVVQAIPVSQKAPEAVSVSSDGYPVNPEPDKKFTCTPERAREVLERAAKEGRKLRQDEKADLYGPPVLLAHSWDGEQDPTGWWLSEKRDGVRAYWDGKDFLSRNGNIYTAPEWFKAGLPDCPLDGELIIGRGKFAETISVVKTLNSGDAWKQVKYEVFDAPSVPGGFEERIAKAKELIRNAPYALMLDQEVCKGFAHLKSELKRIEALGGEGLMLREPGSKYEAQRSHSLLKVKTFFDAEAEVIGHMPGKGRLKGMTGGLICQLPNGVQFNIGSGISDAIRRNPPPVGTQVTFRYFELSKDQVPRFPIFIAARNYE